jgi:hypothetical protein
MGEGQGRGLFGFVPKPILKPLLEPPDAGCNKQLDFDIDFRAYLAKGLRE